MFKILISYAYRNILRSRFRSLFMVTAISLIFMLYTILTSIADSFASQLAKTLDKEHIHMIVQSRYTASPLSSAIPIKTAERISSMDEIRSSEAIVVTRKKLSKKMTVYLIGVSDFETFANRTGLGMVEGSTFTADEGEVVIGNRLAKILELGVGSRLDIGEEKAFTVVGVYSTWLDFLNASIVLNLQKAQSIAARQDRVNMLFLSLKDEQQTDAVMEQINKTYPNLLAARSGELSKSFLPIKNIAFFSQIISYITLVIASAVALMTFIMAISERTKEIGILQAIGWSRKMILGVFLTESLLIAWVSGAIGFLLSYPGIYLLQKSISVYIYLASSPDLSIFANVLGMCTLLGIVSVLFPALYGTRISASKALRHE